MSNFSGGIPVSVLDDCCLRFLGELDSEDFKDSVRVFFKIEEAHWFYLDHFCESNPILPKVSLRDFCEIVCSHFAQLHRFVEFLDEYWKAWKQYKASIPTAGAILLDESLDYVLVLEAFSGKRWGFPKGKKNNNESMQECAVREVLEETGYDITNRITPDEYLELAYEDMFVQLFIVHGISKDTVFKPQTKGEVKSFEWMLVKELPGATGPQNTNPKYKSSGFFMIRPFVNPLRRWIEMNRKVILGENVKVQPNEAPPPRRSSGDVPRRTSVQKNVKGTPFVQGTSSVQETVLYQTPPKMLDLPFAVQKHAVVKPSLEKTPLKPGGNQRNKSEVDSQNSASTPSQRPAPPGVGVGVGEGEGGRFRSRFPMIVFPDFIPAAWTSTSFTFDVAQILSAIKM